MIENKASTISGELFVCCAIRSSITSGGDSEQFLAPKTRVCTTSERCVLCSELLNAAQIKNSLTSCCSAVHFSRSVQLSLVLLAPKTAADTDYRSGRRAFCHRTVEWPLFAAKIVLAVNFAATAVSNWQLVGLVGHMVLAPNGVGIM